ncbi:hypothetical protein [Luteolibacter luteus]|uniref:DUF1559 domain-containing protein n=1 Tax=Luteolibacter luteus TaxID=2728835 RepID=A0A858RH60_9BACT|nr:hypothetical protein [Luteolibacter luteus]QJE95779.1 hypothetical protein HHL09_08265 [Luteolibacter luteus]
MQTLPQPPSDVPAPPPGAEALKSQRLMRIIFWIGGICVFPFAGMLLLGFLIGPGHQNPDRSEAMRNLRDIALSLFEFDAAYGRFPDASTIPAVKSATATPLTLDDSSSNKLFRQLIANGLKSEKPFWAKTPMTPLRPDDICNTDANALAPGECAFAYIAGLTSSDDPEAPIVVGPLEKGKTTFDPKPFQGKALILNLNISVRPLPIQKDGRVLLNGMDIFDPRQPFWKGKAPNIKWPE